MSKSMDKFITIARSTFQTKAIAKVYFYLL